MLKKNNSYKYTILIGVILITFGITLLSNNYIKTKRSETFNKMNLILLDTYTEEVNEEKQQEPSLDEITSDNNNVHEENKINNNFEPYIAILKIPKIKLERGFYDKNSKLNNVDYNILFHKESDYPDEENRI